MGVYSNSGDVGGGVVPRDFDSSNHLSSYIRVSVSFESCLVFGLILDTYSTSYQRYINTLVRGKVKKLVRVAANDEMRGQGGLYCTRPLVLEIFYCFFFVS